MGGGLAGGSGLGCLVRQQSCWGCSCLKEGPLGGETHTPDDRRWLGAGASPPPDLGLSKVSPKPSAGFSQSSDPGEQGGSAEYLGGHSVITSFPPCLSVTQVGPFQCSRGLDKDMNLASGDPWGQVCDGRGWVLCCQGAAQPSLVTSVHRCLEWG